MIVTTTLDIEGFRIVFSATAVVIERSQAS